MPKEFLTLLLSPNTITNTYWVLLTKCQALCRMFYRQRPLSNSDLLLEVVFDLFLGGTDYKAEANLPGLPNTLLLLLSHFSCVRFCATPQTAAHQAPPSLGYSRQEHWSGSRYSTSTLILKRKEFIPLHTPSSPLWNGLVFQHQYKSPLRLSAGDAAKLFHLIGRKVSEGSVELLGLTHNGLVNWEWMRSQNCHWWAEKVWGYFQDIANGAPYKVKSSCFFPWVWWKTIFCHLNMAIM